MPKLRDLAQGNALTLAAFVAEANALDHAFLARDAGSLSRFIDERTSHGRRPERDDNGAPVVDAIR